MVLHTWTRELTFHPHLHAIVSAGAPSPTGQWVPSREDYLFPVKVMARLFRRFFREALFKAVERKELAVPDSIEHLVRRAVFETKWHVYAKAPFDGAQHVFNYLGRYTHRVGLANSRIRTIDERGVTFATKNGKTCTLEPVEFLRRFLLHVLPKGFHKIRHYGLNSSHHVAAGTLETVCQLLGASEPQSGPEYATPVVNARDDASTPESSVECLLALAGPEVRRCPRCEHGRLLPTALDPQSPALREDSS